jgi:outer membrane protein assembly factor BamA
MKDLLCRMALCALSTSSLLASADETEENFSQVAMLIPGRAGGFADIPSDTELEARRARIGHIQVVIDDVFESTLSLTAPYRMVNALHVTTRTATVNQQLLFRPGDAFKRRILDETARILRDQRYFADAYIETQQYNERDNTVDVLVHVHDVWTMSPGISFGRKGGENSAKIEFEDTNFLGLGKTIFAKRSSDVDRSAWELGYVDPHVLGSWWKLTGSYSTLSDGSSGEFAFGRPFYSLDSRWSAGVTLLDSDLTTPRYALGKEIERFRALQRSFGFDGGVSHGLEDGSTTRYLFGVRHDARAFAATIDDPDALIPDERRYTYPYVGIQWIEDAYVTTRNLDQIGRTEDLHLGRSLTATIGFASTAFGSTNDAMILTAEGGAGIDFGNEQYAIGDFALSSRLESGGLRNAQLDLGARYYKRQSEHRVLFAGMAASFSSALDEEVQLMLGGDSGLRGYPLRYQAGTSRAMFTLEERFYTNWQLLKLANVGAAAFVDAGRMWGEDRFAPPPEGWLTDVGVGLRLGSARSGLGNILHVDIAFPLNRDNGIDGLQLLIETKKSF